MQAQTYDQCWKLLPHCKPSHAKIAAPLIVGLELDGQPAPDCSLAFDFGVRLRWQQVEVLCWADLLMVDSPPNRYSSFMVLENTLPGDMLAMIKHVLRSFPNL